MRKTKFLDFTRFTHFRAFCSVDLFVLLLEHILYKKTEREIIKH